MLTDGGTAVNTKNNHLISFVQSLGFMFRLSDIFQDRLKSTDPTPQLIARLFDTQLHSRADIASGTAIARQLDSKVLIGVDIARDQIGEPGRPQIACAATLFRYYAMPRYPWCRG